MEALQQTIIEHQRQLTHLYELYERSKSHNDARAYVTHQSIEQVSKQLGNITKDTKQCAKSFENINFALKNLNIAGMFNEIKDLQKITALLVQALEETKQINMTQNQTITRLENFIQRIYVNENTSVQQDEFSRILGSYSSGVFNLITPEVSSIEHSNVQFGEVSPFSLAETNV
jgi:hypothetical protein